MADYITAIRTVDGDKKIDYNSLANLPTAPIKHNHNAADVYVSNTLAANLGITSTPTVEAAFNATQILSEYRIGDVKFTARNDLGENWILCDGRHVLQSDYPELTNVLGTRSDVTEIAQDIDLSDTNGSWSVLYTGKNLINFYRSAADSTSVTAGSPMTSSLTRIEKFSYMYQAERNTIATNGNGVCVIGSYYNSSPEEPRIHITTDHGASWKTVTPTNLFSSSSDNTTTVGAAYHNGTWVVAYQYSKSLYLYTSTVAKPTSASNWASSVITLSEDRTFGGLSYFNGYWIATARGSMLKSSDLVTWTIINDSNIDISNSTPNISNGVYFTGGRSYSYDLVNWYHIRIGTSYGGATMYGRGCTYVNGLYITQQDGQKGIYASKSLENTTWLLIGESDSLAGNFSLLTIGNYFVFVNQMSKQICGIMGCYLPTVSVGDGVNAYIRSKGGSSSSTSKSVVRFAITKAPTKTYYVQGEDFNKAGMVVTVTYDDGTSKTVTNYTVQNGTNLRQGTTSVSISYSEGGYTFVTKTPITVGMPDTVWTKYSCDIGTKYSYNQTSSGVGTTGTSAGYMGNTYLDTLYTGYEWGGDDEGWVGTGAVEVYPTAAVGYYCVYSDMVLKIETLVPYTRPGQTTSDTTGYSGTIVAAATYSSSTTYSQGSTNYGTVTAAYGVVPDGGLIIAGSVLTGNYCVVRVGDTYYYYVRA